MAEAFGVAASALAVVELSAKVVKLCTTYTKGVLDARNEIDRVTKAVKGLGALAERTKHLRDESPRKFDTIEELQPLLTQSHEILEKLRKILEPGKRKTLWTKLHLQNLAWPIKSDEVERMLANLDRLTHSLSVAMQVDQTRLILNVDQKNDLDRLHTAEGAAYDSYAEQHNPRCLPNTRTEVLEAISQWAQDPSSKPVFWLNGMAGTGKSTISRTLAKDFADKGSLGATFFFKRGEGDRGGMSKLFTTMSNQLIERNPSMATYVQDAIERDKGISTKGLQEQFDKLIKIPISSSAPSVSTQTLLLVILDALDECGRMEDIGKLLEILSSDQQFGNIRLKFFLTSRPEIPAREGFREIDEAHQNLILHQVSEDVIEQDIAAFFQHELVQVRNKFNRNTLGQGLPENWPAEDDISILVKMAVPLFIFAATVCRFINEGRVSGPDERLKRVLEYQTKSQISKLEATYLPVLDQMVDGLDSSDRAFVTERFRKVVGSIITLASSLPSSSLARLIEVPEKEIYNTVRSLHSVLDIPSSPQQPIRIFHLSFRDFLANPEWDRNEFWIDEKGAHRQLALSCLEILETCLTTDICQVRDSTIEKWDITASRIDAHLPPELQYACCYWVFHLKESTTGHSMAADVERFCSEYFLQWIEALGWIGEGDRCVAMVNTLQSIFTTEVNQEMSESLTFLKMFAEDAGEITSRSPLAVHSFAPLFFSIGTIFRDIYRSNRTHWPFLYPNGHILSRKCQDMLEDHTTLITAFSSDGKLMATGSTDHTVTIWMAETGERLHTLRLHLDSVEAIAFSPNGRLIATAAVDETVILSSTETGQHIQTLTSNSNPVDAIAVAFSPNGQFVGFVSEDRSSMWTITSSGQWRTLWSHYKRDDSPRKSMSPLDKPAFVQLIYLDWMPSSMGFDEEGCIASEGDFFFTSASHTTGAMCPPGDSGQNHTLQQPARITSIVLRPDGRLATSVTTDSAVVLWTGHMNGRHQPYDNSARLALTAFSPDSKKFSLMSR